MATITTLNSGDSGATSRTTINDNFTNLNNDKVELTTAQTLTNKTIDASSNTITNLGTTNFATAAKTGVDTKVVTGTAGSTDNLAKWNSDDDLVDAGVAVSTDDALGGGSPSDLKVPTEQAVKTYADALNVASRLQVSPTGGSGTTTTTLGYLAQSIYMNSVNDYISFDFLVPSNAGSVSEAKLVLIHENATSTSYGLTVNAYMAASGEDYDNTSDSGSYNSATLTQSEVEILDITTAVSNAAVSEWVSLKVTVTSSTNSVYTLHIPKLIITFA